ncbi:ATP-binding protein [Candidatus Pseudoruminococcus sp.]|uniref:sensor histidine kinase n=1 Tax=Candidatus Pseudoruminococcus sp. TaxID=3101048 RepID=UPI00399AEC43|nr:HAMP domain-containing histidine kinase [Ruminococcus sp.]
MKGITKRWLINSMGVIMAILLLIVVVFALFVQSFYYNGIMQTISGRSSELANMFNKPDEFISTARVYVENFPDKELMELMVINSNGDVVITSTGFEPDKEQVMPDYEQAKSEKSEYATWTGRLNSGENVMALTRMIYGSDDEYVGAVRYIVSLEEADRRIFITISGISLVGLLVLFLIIISSTYFLRSIVKPVREIGDTAKRIAQGDFNARIGKFYDDEIGELCDTINYMAGELGNAEKMKNDFISSVSHELRTPLTAIKGWAETMQMGGSCDAKTMEKGLKIIVNESERLSGIVEELLDFSRIQNNRMVLKMDKIDILAEIDEAIYMLRERALSENKHLIYEEPEILPAVLGDKNRLRQVFINIIDNALKYTPEGGIINIEVSQVEENIVIKISDNGCGIPARHLSKVKEKFYKANQTQRGSGIGLAVADEIVKLHSGTLDIASTEGVGTVVSISIPILKEEPEEPKEIIVK